MSKPELVPNRDLLNPNFTGYKLSLDKIPAVDTTLDTPLCPRSASESQFSFLHAKTFARSGNLLVSHLDSVYLLHPGEGSVQQVLYLDTGRVELVPVFQFPAGGATPRAGDYNPSLVVAGGDVAAASDGRGMLFLLGTKKGNNGQWTALFHQEALGDGQAFLVADAKACVSEGKTTLNILLQYVATRKDIDEASESTDYCTAVEWLTYTQSADSWSLERARRFAFQGSLDFLSLSEDATNLLACTEKTFSLVYDSQGLLPSVEEKQAEAAALEVKRRPKFYYRQDVEDIIVWVQLPENTGKRDLKVSLKPRELSVVVRGEPVVSGGLHHIVRSDSLTWTIQKGRLEIIMTKANEGRIWTAFYADGSTEETTGEEVQNPAHIDEIEAEFDAAEEGTQTDGPPEGTAYNSAELEACDAIPDEEFSMNVFDGGKNEKGACTTLHGHQWLFNSKGEKGQDLVCLRYDVDGLNWQADAETVTHVSTFPALGYVQASKSSRKFTVASPDASYAAICDRSRHVYVYRQPSAIAKECDLRNRKSGQRVTEVAQQQVITLEDSAEELVGAVATIKSLLLATEGRVVAVRVNA